MEQIKESFDSYLKEQSLMSLEELQNDKLTIQAKILANQGHSHQSSQEAQVSSESQRQVSDLDA